MDMQNVSNLQIPEGAVRTIHDKDSRLIWGRLAYDTKYAGDIYQQTYSGKNLFNVNGISGSFRANKTISDQAITSTATATGTGYVAIVIPNSDNLLGKECSISFSAQASIGIARFRIAEGASTNPSSVGSVIKTIVGNGSKTETFNFPASYGTGKDCFVVLLYPHTDDSTWNVGDYATFTNIQLEVGSTAAPYEPYTGGIPAPNPDYPQAVQTVAGEQTVTVSDSVDSQNYLISLNMGNMAPISGFQLGGMNSGVPSSGNKYQINNGNNPIKVNPNTQYTISVNLGETVKGVRVGIHSCDADLNFLNDSGWKQIVPTPYTFTTGANVEYVKLIFSLSTTSSAVNTTTQDTTIYGTVGEWLRGCSLKMNEGSSIISDIELCKIGTYQDYIYKSGDEWYVHKAIGKISSYNGETITTDYISTTGSLTNGATVYYGLATTADTQITDATLVRQLDAVHEWLTRYGYSSTVTGNLPIVIDKTNL